ncbi:MAG: hypothetical protein FJ265_16060 [Planctomycetes bacterium]|nr:hypothetical protein [Planctomycetota bacterium]
MTAIPGLVVGFYSLVQSFAELAREVYKAAETLKMAGADALSSLEQLEKRYKGAGGGRIGVTEVAAGVVNKLFSGFVELNTITTLSSKFELWGNKILVVDQKTHGLAKKLPELFRRIEELQRLIMLAERPPVPSRDGCKLKVPPPLPSKQGRPSQHPPKPTPPEIPSKGGRIPVVAVKEILGLRVPPPVPSTLGRPAPPVMPAPTTVSHPVVESRNVKAKTLAELRGKVNTTVTKVADLQAEVKKHKFLQERYKGALDGLKGRKPTEALFLETLGNVTVAIAKSGITLGLGGFDLSNGVKTVAETVGNVSQFVVGSIMDATVLSADLAENMGDLGSALREKAKLERLRK